MRISSENQKRSYSRPLLALKILFLLILSVPLYMFIGIHNRVQSENNLSTAGVQASLNSLSRANLVHTDDTDTSRERQRAISDAVNTLRCLTIPQCYPTIRCSDGAEPMKIPVGRQYEQQAFCTGDLVLAAQTNQQSKCLVYSFGINDNVEWEEKIAQEFGCDVFAFDPTSKFDTNVAPGVTFHQLGLQGAGVDVSKTHSHDYDALDPTKLRSLGEIMKLMGHENRNIDVLRLDCEGCEWGVLKQLACSGESQFVKQLMVEMHFQKNLGLASDDDVLIAADAITCLEDERWAIASMEKQGCGPKDAQYTESVLKFLPASNFLLYVTMKRLPYYARWNWGLYGSYVKEDSEQLIFFAEHQAEHGLDPSKWPDDLKRKYDELGEEKMNIANEIYKPLYGDFFLPEYKTYQEYSLANVNNA